MMKTFQLLLRGVIADNAQAVHNANAVAILRQQIREAAAALSSAKRELAIAMAFGAAEERALAAIAARIETLSEGARKAIADGREDLGHEAAALIAALEDESEERRKAAESSNRDVQRLRRLIAQGEERLRDLDRGLQTARATEAVRRAGLNGRRALTLSRSTLGEAEETLARLRERHRAEEDVADALGELDGAAAGGVEAALDAGGYGRSRTDPKAVFERLKASAANH